MKKSNVRVIRINHESAITDFRTTLDDTNGVQISFMIDDQLEVTIDSQNQPFLWYRRGDFNLSFNKRTETQLRNYLHWEQVYITRFLHETLEERCLNKFSDNKINKLTQLRIAAKAELRIPHTKIISQKAELEAFMKACPKISTKAIYHGINATLDGHQVFGYTNIFTSEDLEQCPNHFFPTLFQEYIEKEFEIRSFYLDGTFYSSAVFSQSRQSSKIDARLSEPNASAVRTVPIVLPKQLEEKLHSFAQLMEIQSGSFDLLFSTSGEWYFLEVNPVGRFGQVSSPCAYGLEEKIADYLIERCYE